MTSADQLHGAEKMGEANYREENLLETGAEICLPP